MTSLYLHGIPYDTRASKTKRVWLTPDDVKSNLPKVQKLNELAQMVITWTLRNPAVTSALVGASSFKQLEGNLAALNDLKLNDEELDQIEATLRI